MLWIMVESNAKVCVDSIVQDLGDSEWVISHLAKKDQIISTICNDVKVLASEFFFYIFYWVPHEVNMVVHTFTKLFPL